MVDGWDATDEVYALTLLFAERMRRVPEDSMAYDRWNDVVDTMRTLWKQVLAAEIAETVVRARKEIDDGFRRLNAEDLIGED